MKSLGLYQGKTVRLEKKDKDRINRAYAKFSHAANNPENWKGVKVTKAQARAWKERGASVNNGRVAIYSKGYDHIRKTRKGDVILSNAEKSKRLTLETDPDKLAAMAKAYGRGLIGIQIGGTSLHVHFNNWADAVAYAHQLTTELQDKGSGIVPLPVFVSGEPHAS